jgi:hypothetical protein
MTTRRLTPEELAASDAWVRQWWLWFATLGLLASKPELKDELEAEPEMELQ